MAAVDAYLAELARRAAATLGGELVGVYAGGSVALGGYEPGRSDLDVAVVVAGPLEEGTKRELVERLRHEALPCPARGLELVVYARAAAASPDTAPAFELNLNTGAAMPFRVDLEPDPAEGHWFAIDRAILRERGVALAGPPPDRVFGPIPPAALLPVVAASLRWHEHGDAAPEDAVLNACRALHYARTGTWTSKPAAGRWAIETGLGGALVAAALGARTGGTPPDRAEARAFVADALRDPALDRARAEV